jgi:hypothetical protein
MARPPSQILSVRGVWFRPQLFLDCKNISLLSAEPADGIPRPPIRMQDFGTSRRQLK